MFFVIVGVILILLNLLGIGPVGQWNWEITGNLWRFCLPFLCAAAWWAFADASGLNKRREMERMEDKKRQRRKENLASLGLDTRERREPPAKKK